MKAVDEVLAVPRSPAKAAGIRPEILLKMADVPLRKIVVDSSDRSAAVTGGAAAGLSMAMSRAALPRIDFLAPEATPAPSDVAQGVSRAIRLLCAAALDLTPSALAAALTALSGRTCGVPRRAPRSLAQMIAVDEASDSEVHDLYFRVGRATDSEPAFYLQSLLQSLMVFREDVEETPVTVDRSVLAAIETGLLTTISLALGEGVRRSPGRFARASVARHDDHAARRWIRGHQIFAALSQGLIASLNALDDAIESGAALPDAVRPVVIGLDACAAAFRFAGDLAEHVYDEHIRPSMCPPHAPRGFSGLLSADHLALVRRMKEMRPALEALRARDPQGHADIAAALAGVYDHHKHVCAKFVGTERSSLLMVDGSGRSSVEQLERFKTMRIRSLG